MRLHRTTIAIFSLTILAHLVWHLNWAANRFGFEEVSLGDYPLHLIVLAPAVGYFVGYVGSATWWECSRHFWCRCSC
jgi:hypothetical protein